MCNSYRINPQKNAARGVSAKVSAAAAGLARPLVRKSEPGVVVLAGWEVATMRWGFRRSFNPAVNNARADKLKAGMWAKSLRTRRCLIPVSAFYEWGPGRSGPAGRKQAYEIRDPAGDYLWVAGIWETDPALGPCYSMVTTAASAAMAAIHHRMPAIFAPDLVQAFLDLDRGGFGRDPWPPFDGPLLIEPCASPLAKQPDDGLALGL